MRVNLTAVFLIVGFLQVSVAARGQKVTLNEKSSSLEAVFKKIQQQTGYDFLYKKEWVKDVKTGNLRLNEVPLAQALDKLFENKGLDYEITDNTVVISKKEPGLLEKVVERFQTIDVRGRVVDSTGRPLVGASVRVKGAKKFTLAGIDGGFVLNNVDEGASLLISYIGYLTKEVNASSDLTIIILEASNSKLDEVQVIAYGTTSKRFSTSNVGTVNSTEIRRQPVSNPLLSLQGRIPGLFIKQGSGATASPVTVTVQGLNSIGNGNEPFYVIDGVPYQSDFAGASLMGDAITGGGGSTFNLINPADIESISILKDADATAIYGSRAANGAILITTKRGKAGKTKIDVNAQNGWGKITKKLSMLNTSQYLEMRKEAYRNSNQDVPSQQSEPTPDNYDLTVWSPNKNTDWQKELVGGTAHYTDVNASISGGNSNTQLHISPKVTPPFRSKVAAH